MFKNLLTETKRFLKFLSLARQQFCRRRGGREPVDERESGVEKGKFFAHANISEKSKPFAKILQHMKIGEGGARMGLNHKKRGKNIVRLSF